MEVLMLSRPWLAFHAFLLVATPACGARSGLGVDAASSGASTGNSACVRAPEGVSKGGDAAWSERCPGVSIEGIVVDPAGNIVLALWSSAENFGGPPSTFALVSLDPDGSPRWSIPVERFWTTPSGIGAASLLGTDAAGNVYVAASAPAVDPSCGPAAAPGNAVVLKVAPSGECLWARAWGQAQLTALTVDASGAIVVAGYAFGPVDFGTGVINPGHGETTFLARLDPQGNGIWSREVTGAASILCLATSGSGDTLVAGAGQGEIDIGGQVLASSPSQAVLAARLGTDGMPLYAKLFGPLQPSPGLLEGFACAADAAGGLTIAWTLLAGSQPDFGGGAIVAAKDLPFMVKLDSAGGFLWQKTFPLTNTDQVSVHGLASDAQGSVVWTGELGGTFDFGTGPLSSNSGELGSVWIAVRYKSSGAIQWARRFQSSSYSQGIAVAMDPEGSPVVGGDALGSINFGQGALQPLGRTDVVVSKLRP
jgi:hypothetical protein